jgi:hypothetical protein
MRFAILIVKAALVEVLRKYSFVKAPDTEVPDPGRLTVLEYNLSYISLIPMQTPPSRRKGSGELGVESSGLR